MRQKTSISGWPQKGGAGRARRGENIYRRKDGRWEGRYMKGRKEDGKPRYGYGNGAGDGAVKSRLLRLKHRYLGVGPGSAGTFSDFARS
ncbi:MAG: hypothetical protein LBL63_02045, partial [Clostridiales Family XIII bacterium]|nr:hypothetical protein [Clostridiales Family XIII bacterium]